MTKATYDCRRGLLCYMERRFPKLDTFERYERVLPNQSGRLCNRQGHPRLTSFCVVVSTCCSKTQLLSWNSQIKILGMHAQVWTTSSNIDQGSNRKRQIKWGHSLAELDSNGDEEQSSSFLHKTEALAALTYSTIAMKSS
jgi:hypothetical protein